MNKVAADKIENYADKLLKLKSERQKRMDHLLERLVALNLPDSDKLIFINELRRRESEHLRYCCRRISISYYAIITQLGHGAYGYVYLARSRIDSELCAIKYMSKHKMIQQNKLQYIKLERDLMASTFSDWIVRLYCSFYDEYNLYLVMDYAPGGDLMGLLIRNGTLPENVAKFYIAELLVAFNDLHENGIIYRDGKPDNVLITKNGHIKLTDFGLSCRGQVVDDWTYCGAVEDNDELHVENTSKMPASNQKRRLQAFSRVGTLSYTAVEILRAKPYSEKCDFWSAGCILYECVFGRPPFYSESRTETYKKVINHKTTLHFPQGDAVVSDDCCSFISRLICEPEERMGFSEIYQHPFMKGVAFRQLENIKPPFIPKLTRDDDTQYFDMAGKESLNKEPVREQWWDDGVFEGYSHRAFPETKREVKGRISIKGLFQRK